VGILGFGKVHLSSIRTCEKKGLCRLEALVITDMENSREALQDILIESPDLRIYNTMDALFDRNDPVDLICLPTGIGSHKELSVLSLDAGYHVLCEKPAAGTLDDALMMAEARDKSGKVLAIGFQNLFSPSIQQIKSLALSGDLGHLIEARSVVGWPRFTSYYARNRWAGQIYNGDNFIFDSPLQNATAHFLQNMLYVAGQSPDECCSIESVYGENYHFNPIPSADTQFIRVCTATGAVLSMAASHAVKDQMDARTEYIFEKGRILWSNNQGDTTVSDSAGIRIMQFDNGDESLFVRVFEQTIMAIEEGRTPFSHIHNALAHTRCMDLLFRSMNPPSTIHSDYGMIEKSQNPDEGDLWYIRGLEKALDKSFKTGLGFFEMNLPWACKGEILTISRL